MNSRERLVSLIDEAMERGGRGRKISEAIADHLIDGGVIAPPCKVGDTVYMPWLFDKVNGIAHLTVTSIVFESDGATVKTDLNSDAVDYLEKYKFGKFKEDDFGKTVFLTREEAEAALAERSKG